MATKTWKIEKDLCRCCHAEGAFDNLAEPRLFLEKEEVYSDMLRECLDIDIPPVPGELCAITYTICNACIIRLRDACNFKKQVQDCEQRFMTLYYKNAIQGLKPATKVKEEMEVTVECQPTSDTEADIVLKKEDEDDDDDLFLGGSDDDSMSDDLPIKPAKQSVSTMKTRPKPKPKPAPKAKAPAVKKLKPPPKPKKEEPKPAKEKKGPPDVDKFFSLTLEEDGTTGYTCNVCKKTLKKIGGFRQHYRLVHLKLTSRRCRLCDETVPQWRFVFHMDEKHGVPAPTCGACGRKFRKKGLVLKHQKYFHLGESQHRCETCNKQFSDKSVLNKHMAIHRPEKLFVCDICQKGFKTKSQLQTHIGIHYNIKPYSCQVCRKTFVQKCNWKTHMLTRHPNIQLDS